MVIEFLRSAIWATFKYTRSIVNHSHYVVHSIPRIYLSYNWEFVPFGYFNPNVS